MKAGRIVIGLVALLTVLRVVLVCLEEPSPRETYYFLCAGRPAPAYFDGPAGTAVLVRLAGVFGESDVWWRLQAPLWALAATLACYLLVRRLGDGRSAAWTALGLNALPMFNMAALRVGPELPALTFALLALYCAWRAYGAERRLVLWWLAAGVATGLASCFMYISAALVPAMVLFTLWSPRHRRAEHVFGLFLLTAVPAFMLTPALVWNASVAWIPIAGGTLQTLWQFEFAGFFVALARLAVAFSPVIFLLILWVWVSLAGEVRGSLRARFLCFGALPGVALGAYFALRGQTSAFLLLVAAPLLLFKLLTDFSVRRLMRGIVWVGFVLAVVLSGYGMWRVVKTGQHWGRTAAEVRHWFTEKSVQDADGLFLIAQDEALASVLSYHLRDVLIPPAGHPVVYERESQYISTQFGLWPSYDDFVETGKTRNKYDTKEHGENPFVDHSALYISRESADEVPQTIKAAFESITFLHALPPAGANPNPRYIYLCVNYQTLPL